MEKTTSIERLAKGLGAATFVVAKIIRGIFVVACSLAVTAIFRGLRKDFWLN